MTKDVFETRQQKYTMVFNEYTVLTSSYFMHLFSDLMADPGDRHSIGYAYIGLILTNIAVQLILMIVVSILRGKLWCRKRYVAKIKLKMQKQ